MQKNTGNILGGFGLAAAVLLFALVGVPTPGALAKTRQTGPTQVAASETSAGAKRVADKLTSYDLKRVKKSKLRDSWLRAFDALKAVAKNTSPSREAALIADFDRAIKSLKSLPQPAAADTRQCDAHYERCIELCKEAGGNYGKDCKLCGIEQNGCYLTKLAMEMTKDPNDPTP